jgi:hypothetical protein
MKKELIEVSEEASPMAPTPEEEEERGSFPPQKADISRSQVSTANRKYHSARRSVVSELIRNDNESIRCWN